MTREVRKTEEGREYTVDLLSKEIARLRKSLTRQASVFDELIKTTNGNTEMVKQELEKLEATFAEFNSTSARLCELVSNEKATQINDAVKSEGDSVTKISRAVKNWLVAQEEVENRSCRSQGSRSLRPSESASSAADKKEEDKDTEERDNMTMMVKLMRTHSDLQKQMSLLSDLFDLFEVRDIEVLRRETAEVDRLYNELVLAGNSLCESLSMEEKAKISGILETSKTEVAEIVSTAHGIMLTLEDERHSVRSLSSRSRKSTYSNSKSTVKKPRGGGLLPTNEYKERESRHDEGSIRSEASKKSKQSSRLGSNCSKALRKKELDLRDKVSEIQHAIVRETRMVEDSLWQGNVEGLHGKIQSLESLQKEREPYAVLLYSILTEEGATQLSEEIARLDGRIEEIKVIGIQAILRPRDHRKKGSQKSSVSKPSRKNPGISVCSSIESVSNFSMDSSRGSRMYAAKGGKKTGSLVQRELIQENLKEKFHRRQQEYEDQKVLCGELIRSTDPVSPGDEIQKLEKTYQRMADTGFRLREQLPSLEADQIDLQIEMEDTEVFEVKKQMIRRMARATDGMREQEVPRTARGTGQVGTGRKENEEEHRLRSEMTRVRARLENQGKLIDDLLHTDDKEMISRELNTLDKAFDAYVAIVGQLRNISNSKDAAQMSQLIAEEDAKVFQKKKIVTKLLMDHTKKAVAGNPKDSRTRHETTDQRRTVETVVVETNQEKEPQDIEETEKELHKKKDFEVMDCTDGAVASLTKLNELMVQTLKLQAAPKVEIDIFSGDPLEFSYFIENFKDLVESLVSSPKQRLVRLLKYTSGEAKDLIKHCVHEEPLTCYDTAVSLLEKEYGNPFKITCAYLEKLKTWPQIKGNDAAAMKNLYRFLLQCSSYQRRNHIDLDSPLTIRSIQLALPINLQDRWTARVGKIRKRKGVEATFVDFVDFVEEEAQCLSDPVYSRDGFKDKSGKLMKALATKGKEGEGDGDKSKCPACAAQHDLDECPTFLAMTARDKKDLLFKLKMCFCCYEKDHLATKCSNKRTCKTCGEGHPTGLHGVTFKVSAVQQGGSAMCIVPVRLRHETWQEKGSTETKEIEVYAMLDECSEGTFISESLLDLFGGESKRKTSIHVETVNHSGITEAFAVNGLVVRGSEEFETAYKLDEIELPVTFSRENLPMDREDVPTAEMLTEWEYLNDVVRTLPGVKDIPLGLLIGNNCPKAQEPMEVIASKGGGPYAKRTRLGWCVSAPMREEGSSRLRCSSIRVCETRIKDNAIDDALQAMWMEDFVEKESEKRALSKEDRRFLGEMGKCITFSEGHYILPLPLRKQACMPAKEEPSKGSHGQLDYGRYGHQQFHGVVNEEDADQIKPSSTPGKHHTENVRIVTPEEVAVCGAETDNPVVEKAGPARKGDYVVMPDNRGQALHRLKCTKRRMMRDTKFKEEYCKFMGKLLGAGHARKVPEDRLSERAWYLPHHGVYHRTKKKMRVVHDCSAEKEGVSLNSKLMQGPDFANSLLGVLARFRLGLIPMMADIEAMYYQVKVPDEHCKFLRFYWWEEGRLEDKPVEYEMCVHPFGAVSSKNCVIFALHQTAFDNKEEFGEEATKTLLHDFYVDDMLKSMDEEEEAIKLIKEVDGMCKAGGFNLTKFVSTNSNVVTSIPIEKRADGLKTHQIGGLLPEDEESALGLLWHMQDDTFRIYICFESDNGTRRGCLSTISRIHDPVGLVCVFVLKGKKILQRMTADSVGWDEKLSPELAKEWSAWREEILLLNELKIQRCYKSKNLGRVVDVTLHCFADASLIGYGVACYLRMVDEEGRVEVSLVMGKSRVSPLKPTTVPRLELTAATVATKIAAMVMEELKIEGLKVYFWIDNKIVLGWIFNSKRRFRTFVANRVQLVETYTDKEQWRHVDTKNNPADFASRGISPKEKDKVDTWLYGPRQLREKDEAWKYALPDIEILDSDAEVKRVVNATVVKKRSMLDVLEERISSWHRMRRSIVWTGRFGSKDWRADKREEITVTEIEKAEMKIIKLMQERAYEKEIEALRTGNQGKNCMGKLEKLNPFVDEDGVLRVGGRLGNAQEDDTFRFPVIIPKGAVATKVLIEWHHKQIEHRGKHATVNRLREQGFWVVNSSKEVGAVVFRCVRCRWLRGKFGNQKMADLPWNRTTVAPPFTYCGVDVFGPMLVKEGRKVLKRYGVLFTCFSLRAVHIELAATLGTDSFIQSLRRFIARRGAVREIRSDNGTNFVGADNELKKAVEEMDQGKIGDFLTEQGCDYITWERNTPVASHMGGVWERQIRTIKSVLCSLLKSSPRRLDEESLRTFLAEAESIVNSRPLTLESLHDPESQPLTPNQILTMKTRVASPPPGVFQGEGVYARKRWRVVQHMANSFWSRWRKEYLQLLQCRQKWTGIKRDLQGGDVVLLKDDGASRNQWPLALVTGVHRSKDGLVRSVSLRAKGSTFDRPVHKTVLLVAREEESQNNALQVAPSPAPQSLC